MRTVALPENSPASLSTQEVRLLARTAQALLMSADGDKREAMRFLACAAAAGDRDAQLSLGLLLARMDIDGNRSGVIEGIANYKEAIRWLALAADQGIGKAWYTISRIYQRAEFSQRSLVQSHAYLRAAASAGYFVAQRELGLLLWRTRKSDEDRDVLALYWLRRAADQGCRDAASRLARRASHPRRAAWAEEVQRQLALQPAGIPTVVGARIALAAHFGLSVPETLLIDLASADRGHCLLVDIRPDYARGKRRLILVACDEDRAVIDRLAQVLQGIDCSPGGPEGRYRQRLYRLKKLIPDWSAVQRLFRGGFGTP